MAGLEESGFFRFGVERLCWVVVKVGSILYGPTEQDTILWS